MHSHRAEAETDDLEQVYRVAAEDARSLSSARVRPRGRWFFLPWEAFALLFTALWGWCAFLIWQHRQVSHAGWAVLLPLVGLGLSLLFVYFGVRGFFGPATTAIQFLFDEKATVLTRHHFFKKRIAALPTAVEIIARKAKYGYTGAARLRLGDSGELIYFLYAHDFDEDGEAMTGAAAAAAELAGKLRLQSERVLQDWQKDTASPKMRLWSLFYSLAFGAISAGLFFMAFEPAEYLTDKHGHPMSHADQIMGRLGFGCAGTVTAALAVFGILSAINPNFLSKKRKSGKRGGKR